MVQYHKTIEGETTINGIGLHTGQETSITFKPAQENTGIRFVRKDLPNKPVIEVKAENAVLEDSLYLTALGRCEQQIMTVELVLSAVSGLGIDNINLEVSSSEPPICDGSAKPFVDALLAVGLVQQTSRNDISNERADLAV